MDGEPRMGIFALLQGQEVTFDYGGDFMCGDHAAKCLISGYAAIEQHMDGSQYKRYSKTDELQLNVIPEQLQGIISNHRNPEIGKMEWKCDICSTTTGFFIFFFNLKV